MGNIRNPLLTPDTYKRLIQSWASSELNVIMEFTAPTRYEKELVSYCAENDYGVYIVPARSNKCTRFTVRKYILSNT